MVLPLLVGMATSLAARAATVTVPDQAPTIQAALGTGADTVLVRPGVYAENPVVSRAVSLQGAGGSTDLPELGSLTIVVPPPNLSPELFVFQRLKVAGRVLTIGEYRCHISFRGCDLREGVVDSSLSLDILTLTLAQCSVAGLLRLRAIGEVRVDSCNITGHLAASDGHGPAVTVRGCHFTGSGSYVAINSSGHSVCTIRDNRITGYSSGIVASGDNTLVTLNVIEDCLYDGIVAGTADVTVEYNTIRRCETGIRASGSGRNAVRGNRVERMTGVGVSVGSSAEMDVADNVVVGCMGDGIEVVNTVKVTRNTSCFNGGSGYVSASDPFQKGQVWIGNIGYRNGRYGISWPGAEIAASSCNDWFENDAGDVEGSPAWQGDLSVDPQFCDAANGDFRLNSVSPLVGAVGCGQIGALGVGCGITATVVQRFTAAREGEGIRIVWQVADGSTASEVWLERSDAGVDGGWFRPGTERSSENGAVVELDRSASANEAFWYRLVALEDNEVLVIGQPIRVEAQVRLESRLIEVGPNPASRGPVKVTFALERAAPIEIDVFDVQGRRIASPARGEWPAGTHAIEWDGRIRDGKVAPAGLYVLRYVHPGGQDKRAIVRVN